MRRSREVSSGAIAFCMGASKSAAENEALINSEVLQKLPQPRGRGYFCYTPCTI
jgi:hypothetical protein